MDLVTLGSLRAAQLVWRPAHGGFVLTVVVKATFALRPGVSPLAPSQQAVATADVYDDDGGALVVASELVPLKRQPEVLLTGQAYAPQGKRGSSFVARLLVGEIDKAVCVEGDRTFGLDGQASEPAPFVRMPLVWQRAAGGPDTPNPVGRSIGAHARPDAHGRVLAPNLLPLGFHLRSRNDSVPPVGFGPVAPHWPSRAGCLHRHLAGWDPARWHERPLPNDIDLGYFNAAPADQRRAAPFGEEQLSLSNLHPLFAELSTRLAPVTPNAMVERGQGSEPLQLRCDTLLIDSDRGLAMLVWRAHVVIERPDQPGRIVVSDSEANQATPSVRPPKAPVFDHTQAADLGEQASIPLPFADTASSPAAGPGSVAAPPAENPLLSGATLPVDALFSGTMAFGFANAAPAMPFPTPRDSAPPREIAPADAGAALPFQPAPASELPIFSPEPIAPMAAPPSIPMAVASSPQLGLPTSPVTHAPVPPPMLGTAGIAVDISDEPTPTEAPPSRPPMRSEEGAAAVAPGSPADIDAYPPARCGAIAARIECNESQILDILRAEDLDPARWEQFHEHWLDHIDEEASRSRTGPRADYDNAYVAALEAERIPITVDVYASLAEAAERGALDEALAELDFPEDAWLHIQRSWIPRLIADPKLGKQVRRAIAAARAG